jgi:hypothetical protein
MVRQGVASREERFQQAQEPIDCRLEDVRVTTECDRVEEHERIGVMDGLYDPRFRILCPTPPGCLHPTVELALAERETGRGEVERVAPVVPGVDQFLPDHAGQSTGGRLVRG